MDGIAAGANQDVQSDWDETDTADFAFIRNKPTIPTVPNVPSAPSGAGTVVDYNLQVATDGTATWQQDTGGGANSGEQNVQANWDETSTSSDAYIQNKPTDPEIGDKAFSNPPADLTDTEKTAVRTAIGAGTGSSTGGLSTVSADAGITGDGSQRIPTGHSQPIHGR